MVSAEGQAYGAVYSDGKKKGNILCIAQMS